MIKVTLKCLECNSPSINFASLFEPNEKTKIQDTQAHMDINFLARCGSCFASTWEVTDVKELEFERH